MSERVIVLLRSLRTLPYSTTETTTMGFTSKCCARKAAAISSPSTFGIKPLADIGGRSSGSLASPAGQRGKLEKVLVKWRRPSE